ncbi:NADP-dependent isocitrate dehydrogenase [Cocleimonas sp. KMM 6892]|uniref:NADP-dependent isocitrate dehydrogenase n=1 Tax=unclassified Cocleimonas TaxID=2639732 RepID=UPI002DB5A307|nr:MULTISPECIES: NADP-dependent isocitrate dehydrogenase [unclassified Cocleimonas]MEB8430670.1 NADP-dependent isocitrate dehydrogenase [Cocleimonas sp. KMM 6892]MEC4716879.1 NADP-dependent isocitrate dehydrogenase [Cocleimonas sp. KMM 6895]MEC4743891.1 NADP-dependent isocitrate dehydrogenase [Cocleimonas sp. KMM 6896]
MGTEGSKIIYTLTDEAPLLATASLLPILRAFMSAAGVEIEKSDISLAARIIGEFGDYLEEDQRIPDNLADLGRVIGESSANIIKLPNISASVPQLLTAIAELQSHGFALPDYPEAPETDEQKAVYERYAKVLGSAVNPILREGNSDRRAPPAVKRYAQKNPHEMADWSPASRTHVAHMRHGDFYSSEKCKTVENDCTVRMEFVNKEGKVTVLKEKTDLLKGEIIDSMFMSKKALCEFLEDTMEDAKETGVMYSLHVKATMMKVSHPIVFGHAVKVFYKHLFEKHGELFDKLGVNPNNGISSVYEKIETLPGSIKEEILEDIHKCYAERPELAMVNAAKGISNLHAPNDVIVDASMPAMIRNGGKMWGPDAKPKDTKAVMPESTYARIYQEMINFCKSNGKFDPTTMGTVPNVGLMAQKAEEYGSHDKTFEIKEAGTARIVCDEGNFVIEQEVEEGDIWRMCQTKDIPVQDWIKLAVDRAREAQIPAVFWLDEYRPHDFEIIKKVKHYLKDHDLTGVDIEIMSPLRSMRYTLERIIRGKDTISVTGNILRDYLTDLFPIMELGTSAKMLSVVPLMAGGGLFETGAGGTAPVLVKQLLEENHLSWDSLGEFLAITVSLEKAGEFTGNNKAKILAKTLDQAIGVLLDENKSPSQRTGELDSRGSHFYLAMYWSKMLAEQTEDADLAKQYAPLAKQLAENEQKIIEEMNAVQGDAVDIGGYFYADPEKTKVVMRPSETFNQAIREFKV